MLMVLCSSYNKKNKVQGSYLTKITHTVTGKITIFKDLSAMLRYPKDSHHHHNDITVVKLSPFQIIPKNY